MQAPEQLPEVSLPRDRPWLALFAGFIVFWVLFGGIFTDSSAGIIAGLATIGQLIVSVSFPITEMLAGLIARAGITRKP
jgi:hypothetical protein